MGKKKADGWKESLDKLISEGVSWEDTNENLIKEYTSSEY